MSFNFVPLADISKLAWCAKLEKGPEQTATVYHGHAVEVFDEGFVEGAWDGNFLCLDFDQADFFIGTGGKINSDQHYVFATPSHPLERIYGITEADCLYLSNSLPLLLAISQHGLDDNYRDYVSDLASILWGLDDYIRTIPLKNGHELELFYYCNLLIDPASLTITRQEKPPMLPFTNFHNYESRLKATLQKLTHNAKAAHRSHTRYGLVTTISSGYDAAASSAIVKDLGCDIALTFNAPADYLSDSGEAVAQALGYSTIIMKDANDYLLNDNLLEAEFVSSGELGSNIIFTSFEAEFKDQILVLGDRGDYLWGKFDTPNNNLIFENNIYTTTSMIEHRLRVGYLLLPLPLYGVQQWVSIRKITLSGEMLPYTIGGSYCRPIARRIVETAGVKRDQFGMNKQGVGINYHYDNLPRLQKRMSKTAFNSYFTYYLTHKRHWSSNVFPWAKFLWSTRHAYYDYAFRKFFPGKTIFFSSSFASNPGPSVHLFNWGVETMTQRAQQQIQTSNQKRGVT